MTRQLALEYAEDNIRVVAIAPGTFDTPLLRDVAAGIPDKGYMERLRQAYPMKRFGDPAELARVVAFLASDGEERSEEHTSELQSLMRISYAVFCLKKKKIQRTEHIAVRHVYICRLVLSLQRVQERIH